MRFYITCQNLTKRIASYEKIQCAATTHFTLAMSSWTTQTLRRH